MIPNYKPMPSKKSASPIHTKSKQNRKTEENIAGHPQAHKQVMTIITALQKIGNGLFPSSSAPRTFPYPKEPASEPGLDCGRSSREDFSFSSVGVGVTGFDVDIVGTRVE